MKRGQVWIETVLYTLIGLGLIGLVLAFVSPKISESKDKILVEQTINSLNVIDGKVNNVLEAPGNRRFIEFTMKRGEFFISPGKNELKFVISDLSKPYSEPGVVIEHGRIKILSEEGQKGSIITLTISYEGMSTLLYAEGSEEKKFTPSSLPYRFSITNLGSVSGGAPRVSFEEAGS